LQKRLHYQLVGLLFASLFALFSVPMVHADATQVERVQLTVIGDSLADGIWAGLHRNLRREKRFRIKREAKVSSGLAAFDWYSKAERLLADGVDVVVMMVGTNDGQAIRRPGQARIAYRSAGWRDEYAERVDALVNLFSSHGVYTVWIGLPMMRTDSMREQARLINNIFAEVLDGREKVRFFPTWELTSDDKGKYMAYAEIDDSGRQRMFRAKDGVHFTMQGYQYIARHVQQIIEAEYLARHKGVGADEASRDLVDVYTFVY
jgi:hypothetical protein